MAQDLDLFPEKFVRYGSGLRFVSAYIYSLWLRTYIIFCKKLFAMVQDLEFFPIFFFTMAQELIFFSKNFSSMAHDLRFFFHKKFICYASGHKFFFPQKFLQ